MMRTGATHPEPRPGCPLSISREEDFFKATTDVMGYDTLVSNTPEDGDDSYTIAPIINYERLARESVAAVELGVLKGDDDDDEDVRVFVVSYHELLAAFDAIIRENPDGARFSADSGSFDVYEPFIEGGSGQWVNAMMLEKVTRKTRNLRQYIELAEIFGPRALQNERDDAASQFAMMVDGADRGLLVQTVKKYYYGEGSTAAVQFVTGRWFDFLEDTKWDSGRPRGTSPATTREKIVKALPRLAPLGMLLEEVTRECNSGTGGDTGGPGVRPAKCEKRGTSITILQSEVPYHQIQRRYEGAKSSKCCEVVTVGRRAVRGGE
eukprot:1653822-Prymnesium_polylepis.1